jgi:hypothetical protein
VQQHVQLYERARIMRDPHVRTVIRARIVPRASANVYTQHTRNTNARNQHPLAVSKHTLVYRDATKCQVQGRNILIYFLYGDLIFVWD